MIILFISLIFIFLLIFSLIRNINNESMLPREIIYHTFFQVSISNLFLMIFFFQGFFGSLLLFIVTIMLMLCLGIFYYVKNLDDVFYVDGIIRIEAVKNNLIFGLLTVLSLYVFMTIFRYIPWYYQFLLSIVLTMLILIASISLRKALESLYEEIGLWFSNTGVVKYIGIWILGFAIIILGLYFRIPTNNLKQVFNLNNSSGYWVFDYMPIDVRNNFEHEKILDLIIQEDGFFTDYHYDDEHLYLYTDNKVVFINLLSKEVSKVYYLDQTDNSTDSDLNIFSKHFILIEDNILLKSNQRLYLIKELQVILLHDFEREFNPFFYRSSSKLHFLIKEDTFKSDVYIFDDGDIHFVETINQNLKIYDYTLFIEDSKNLILFEDQDVIFSDIEGKRLFDRENNVFYLANSSGYFKVESTGKSFLMGAIKDSITDGIYHDGLIYYSDYDYDYGDYKKIEDMRVYIINPETRKSALFNHLKTQKISLDQDYSTGRITNYKVNEDRIEFLQQEFSIGLDSRIQIFRIVEKEVDIFLPFYSHFNIFILIPIFLAFFIPITDDVKFITYIDFASMTKKDD